MKFQHLLFAVVAAVFLSGCATNIPPLNFSVPNVGVSQKKIDAELRSITITMARPEEATGDLPLMVEQVVPPLLQPAIMEALNKMAIFQDDATKKVSLSVKILHGYFPTSGLTFISGMSARYEIIDRKTGDLIFTQDITSTGSVPADNSLVFKASQRESINRAVQNNIMQFLQALETVDINKPMFPAKRGAAK